MRAECSADDDFRRGQCARGDREKKECDFRFHLRSEGVGPFLGDLGN